MSIQGDLELKLLDAIKNKTKEVSDLRFIKAEFQRGKNKTITDIEAIKILVKLYKSQEELLNTISIKSEHYESAANLTDLISRILPDHVYDQITMTSNELGHWIDQNIDFSSLKNPNQAIGSIKKHLEYVDGNLIKTTLEGMK